MRVILLQDVEKIGKEGDSVKVKDGYARNFLIPRKMATPFSDGATKVLEAKRKRAAMKAEKEKKAIGEVAKAISQLSLTIPMESGVEDALFGSVTPDLIFHALQQEGIQVDKKAIVLNEPIRKLGIYNVEVKLHPEIKQNLRIWVVKK
ncbi:MAG: 50S ribosomal protein L9 [Candidatus Omnitrophota bacterium]